MTDADSVRRNLYSPPNLEQLRKGVMAILRRKVRDRALAEDLCNETFRIVLERLKQEPLDDPEGLAPYLAQTARFLVRMNERIVRRRRTVTGEQETIDRFEDPNADPTSTTETTASARAVRQMLREMPHVRDREVLVRVFLLDQDIDQVCRDLGIDKGHFRRVIYRAKERFRVLIQNRYRFSDLYVLALA